MSDDDVQVNSKILNKLREEKDIRDVRGNISEGLSNGYVEGGVSGNYESARGSDAIAQGVTNREGRKKRREEGTSEFDTATSDVHQRVRPLNRQGEYSVKSTTTDDRRNEKVNFQLRNPFNFKETTNKPVKLFTKAEAELEHDRLVEVYQRGSTLLDDILEIVVKGHEPVQIWALDDIESTMLAELHLERAKTNEQSARSARQLLAIYDRLYFYLLVLPRAKLTAQHVKEHNGLSFK